MSGAVAAAGGADTSLKRAGALRTANATLASRSHAALLELYSLDAQLSRAQARVDALRAQATKLERERDLVHAEIAVAHRALRISQQQLALRLSTLYEQQDTDPLAVLLGAESLDAAITGLDDLSRSAEQNKRIAAESQHAQRSLARLSRTLAAREARVHMLEAAAVTSAASLQAARTERARYIANVASQRRLNSVQIVQLDAQARVAVAKSQALTAAAPPPAPSAPVVDPGPGGGRTLTVSATGYALGGTTATGMPVGWGIVAVDPSVIPLGTRMAIPGYGTGVAADTGSAVQGATIDLWFPTTAQALAWGRRIVTITLY
jgi:3D (Asp-Asp-Asp) domain-containing protein/peptidoglycan hydrolase CwlO-like protein